MTSEATSRVDMHCHSTASQVSKLGVQRSVGLPECATPPEEVYELAKRRGMDFVTITDHDTIAGALEIAHLPDVFVSEELTAHFAGEPQAVHVLCYGIDEGHHEWLQAHSGDVETCAAYLDEHEITCALAHPFYAVEAPLTPRHRRRLAALFPVWETRNGSRARELNMPASVYIDTHDGVGIGGSDDHAGVDVGRTWTQTPRVRTPAEFLRSIRRGHAQAAGEQGSAAKWAHAAIALAVRALGLEEGPAPDARTVFTMIERVMREGDARSGSRAQDLGPEDARALLRAWLHALELGAHDARGLLEMMQQDDFRHADLARRARRSHEALLGTAVERIVSTPAGGDWPTAAQGLFDALLPVLPYAPAAAFLGREKAKLVPRDHETPRVALIADGVGARHGVTSTLEQIRLRGVPGYEVEVIGTDASVDRRLPAAAEVDIPFYEGMEIGVPSLPGLVEALVEGRYDVVHVSAPGPAGVAATLLARICNIPLVASHHTDLVAYTQMRSGDPALAHGMRLALTALYAQCARVMSPSESSDEAVAALGVGPDRVRRWDRGVDTDRFSPGRRVEGRFAGEVNVLYAGRLTREKGADLLGEAFLAARERDSRLHLVLAGGGPEEAELRERLGEHATFLGWLEGLDLAEAYASADVFLFPSSTDTFGQVILEAQASGLPVVAVAAGGPLSLIADGESGLLRDADAAALAQAIVTLARDPLKRARLRRGGLQAVAPRSWEAAMGRLADAYDEVLGNRGRPRERRAA